MSRTALITGIAGQDGRHLAEFLQTKGYRIIGMVNGQNAGKIETIQNHMPYVELLQGDLTDISSLIAVMEVAQPDEVYNLGAQSFVGLSFKQPELTANVTGLGALRLLEAVRIVGLEKKTRIYQASSSEMYGKVREVPQNEQTPFHPRSPYGVAKTFAHYSCMNYREAYGMHISCGILFNHEGEYRGHEFVTRKISRGVARIFLGLEKEIRLGDLSPKRDWGYAGDYVQAMWMMLQQENPDDYVIATGETHSVLEFLQEAFSLVGIENALDRFVSHDSRFNRPSEVELLIGNAEKARNALSWVPKVSFKELVERMVINDLILESNKARISLSGELLQADLLHKVTDHLNKRGEPNSQSKSELV